MTPLINNRCKTALAITDVRPTQRPEIIEVVLESTGKPMRLRRDMVEFWPGRVVIPLWLYIKLHPFIHTPHPTKQNISKQGLGMAVPADS
jgi:hypothetical protein